jgi:hypothetical protein
MSLSSVWLQKEEGDRHDSLQRQRGMLMTTGCPVPASLPAVGNPSDQSLRSLPRRQSRRTDAGPMMISAIGKGGLTRASDLDNDAAHPAVTGVHDSPHLVSYTKTLRPVLCIKSLVRDPSAKGVWSGVKVPHACKLGMP